MQIKRPSSHAPSTGATDGAEAHATAAAEPAEAADPIEGEATLELDLDESSFISEPSSSPLELPSQLPPDAPRTSPLAARLRAAGLDDPDKTVDTLGDAARKQLKGAIDPDMAMHHRSTGLEGEATHDSDLLSGSIGSDGNTATVTAGTSGLNLNANTGTTTTTAGGANVAVGASVQTADGQTVTVNGTAQHVSGSSNNQRTSTVSGQFDSATTNVTVNASTARVRVTSDDEGNLVTTTVSHHASGSVADGNLDIARHRHILTEGMDADGTETTLEREREVRVDLAAGVFSARGSRTRTVDDGTTIRTRHAEGEASTERFAWKGSRAEHDAKTGEGVTRTAGVSYADRRLSVEAEKTAREAAPESGGTAPESSVRAKADVYALGVSAELGESTTDASGVTSSRAARAKYESGGVTLGRARSVEQASGDVSGFSRGVKLTRDSVGLARSRHSVEVVGDKERVGHGHSTEYLVGNHSATVGLKVTETHDVVGEDGRVSRRSEFLRAKGTIDAYQEVKDLGPVGEGAPPELEGQHAVEVHRNIGGSVGGFGGLLIGGVGVYGSLGLKSTREVVYRTHRPAKEAAELAARDEDPSLSAAIRRRTVGMSLARPKITPPDLARPESLHVHDTVELHTRGTVSGGAGVFALGLRAGTHASMTGDFRLSIAKTGENTLVVDVTPTKLRSLQGVGGAILFDVSLGRVKAEAFSQAFEFDLATQSGRHAYLSLLKGQLPGKLTADMIDVKGDGLEALRAEDLPPGVTRLKLEKSEVKERNSHARAGWLFMQATRTKARKSGNHLLTDGEVSFNTHTESIERRRNTLLSGSETKGVTARVRMRTSFDDNGEKSQAFDSLNLTAHYVDDKVRGDSLNEFAIEELNRALGLELKPFALDGDKQARTISASVDFDETALERLSAISYDELREYGARVDVDLRPFEDLIERLGAAQSLFERATIVQAAVADGGIEMMGALTQLAGCHADVKLSTSSSLYDASAEAASTFIDRYRDEPWSSRQDKSELTKRFRDLRQTLDDVDRAIDHAGTDPILATDREALKSTLDKLEFARTGLRSILDFRAVSHETAVTMVHRLSQGWTSGLQARFMDHVIKGAKLTEVDIGARTMRATSQRKPDRDLLLRTRSVAKQKLLPVFADARSQISAASRIARGDDGWDVDQVRLRAELLAEQGGKKSEELSVVLNKLFGTKLEEASVTDSKAANRAVVLERFLSREDLDAIRGHNSASLKELTAGLSGGVGKRVRDLGERLSKSHDRLSLAEAIERHIQRTGLDGMADLHRLARGPLLFHSVSDFYLRAARSVDELAAKLTDEIGPTSKEHEVEGRYRQILTAQAELDDAWVRLESDSLLTDDQRQVEQQRLLKARATLERLSDASHLDLEAAGLIVAALEQGWTSSAAELAIERIRNDTGLLHTERTWPGLIAHGVRPGVDGSLEKVALRVEGSGLFTSGLEEVRLQARHHDGRPGPVQVSVVFTDGRERGDELSTEIVSRLNQALGTSLSAVSARSGDGSAREVTVDVDISEAGLSRLFSLPPEDVARVALPAGIEAAPVRKMFDAVATSSSEQRRHEAVQEFLANTGVEGLGVLVRVLGLRDNLRIDTQSEGYSRALENAEELVGLYRDMPWRATMTREEVLARVDALEKAQKETRATLARVQADPLLEHAHRNDLVTRLDNAERELEAMLKFSGMSTEERSALADRVGRGWFGWLHSDLEDRIRGG